MMLSQERKTAVDISMASSVSSTSFSKCVSIVGYYWYKY